MERLDNYLDIIGVSQRPIWQVCVAGVATAALITSSYVIYRTTLRDKQIEGRSEPNVHSIKFRALSVLIDALSQ